MGLLSSQQSRPLQPTLSHSCLPNLSILTIDGKDSFKAICGVEELEYQRWSTALKRYRSSELPPQHILLPTKISFAKGGICSTVGTAQVYYQKYGHLVSDELHHRSGRKNPFKEPEIWMLLLNIILAGRQAQTFGETLGDVRPQNIFFNEEGKVKVAGRNSWPAALTAFERAVEKTPSFASPEDIKALSNGAMQPCDPYPSEMFAVGLTLLSLANLVEYDSLYRKSERMMDLQGLKEALLVLRLKKRYSQVLRCVIVNLCDVQPINRMTLNELWGILSPHEAKIMSKIPFMISNAPVKLHEQVKKLREFSSIHPQLFIAQQLQSEDGGSGLHFPSHLDVHRVTPEYVFGETKTIIDHLE